jgi:hypothetical protein
VQRWHLSRVERWSFLHSLWRFPLEKSSGMRRRSPSSPSFGGCQVDAICSTARGLQSHSMRCRLETGAR